MSGERNQGAAGEPGETYRIERMNAGEDKRDADENAECDPDDDAHHRPAPARRVLPMVNPQHLAHSTHTLFFYLSVYSVSTTYPITLQHLSPELTSLSRSSNAML